MKQLLDIIERFKWPLAAAVIAVAIVYLVGVVLGDTIGVPAEVQLEIRRIGAAIWAGALSLLAPLVARDADGDGTPDMFQIAPEQPPLDGMALAGTLSEDGGDE